MHKITHTEYTNLLLGALVLLICFLSVLVIITNSSKPTPLRTPDIYSVCDESVVHRINYYTEKDGHVCEVREEFASIESSIPDRSCFSGPFSLQTTINFGADFKHVNNTAKVKCYPPQNRKVITLEDMDQIIKQCLDDGKVDCLTIVRTDGAHRR